MYIDIVRYATINFNKRHNYVLKLSVDIILLLLLLSLKNIRAHMINV